MNVYLTTWNSVAQGNRPLKRLLGYGAGLALLLLTSLFNSATAADPKPINSLKAINFAGLPGNQVQITFELSEAAGVPASFTIDNPARIAFDLPATKSELAKRSQAIGIGPAKSITAVEVKGRTRVVLNLFEMVPYETRASGNNVVVVLGGADGASAAAPASAPAASAGTAAAASANPAVTDVDFRRGDQGEGRVVITLSDPSIPVDMRQEAGQVVLDLKGAQLPEALQRRLDVTDFATPVKLIDAEQVADGTRRTPVAQVPGHRGAFGVAAAG